MIETVMVEVPNPRHPFGLRGVGEAPIIPPLPAVANAVSDAIGVRINKLPITPGDVLEALESKGTAPRARRRGGKTCFAPSANKEHRMAIPNQLDHCHC